MRVSQVIEAMYKLPQDSEIAIDWVTKHQAEQLVNTILTDWAWETAVEEWQLNEFDEDTPSVAEQLAVVVGSRAELAEQNRDYYRDVLGVK